MMESGHHIRTSEEDDRWEEYNEHQAMIEAELAALHLAMISKVRRRTTSLIETSVPGPFGTS